MVSEIVKTYRKIDVVVNVVGAYIGGKKVQEVNEKKWDKMIEINLKSVFLITKNVIPLMTSFQYRKIIHISSGNGIKASGLDLAYALSKAGLIRFVEAVSSEIINENLSINYILPVTIDTETNRKGIEGGYFTRL